MPLAAQVVLATACWSATCLAGEECSSDRQCLCVCVCVCVCPGKKERSKDDIDFLKRVVPFCETSLDVRKRNISLCRGREVVCIVHARARSPSTPFSFFSFLLPRLSGAKLHYTALHHTHVPQSHAHAPTIHHNHTYALLLD